MYDDYVCVCKYTNAHASTPKGTFTHTHTLCTGDMHKRLCTTYTPMQTYAHTWCACGHAHTHIYVCVCVYMYICVYIYECVHPYANTLSGGRHRYGSLELNCRK